MKINNLEVPFQLINLIEKDMDLYNLGRICNFFSFINYPVKFFDEVTTIIKLSAYDFFVNEKFWAIKNGLKEEIMFPFLDIKKSLIIGGNKYPGDDLLIALDYRGNANQPSVVATDFSHAEKHCYWRVIANNIDDLLSMVRISSPFISHAEWGAITLDFQTKFKDAKCFPNGMREWNWKETGTKHNPGVQIKDVEELILNGAECIVLSNGYHEKLQICNSTKNYLKGMNIPYYILNTKDAVSKYNELRLLNEVGGLFHTTC